MGGFRLWVFPLWVGLNTKPREVSVKPAKYRGVYHTLSMAMNAQANANPNTRCARCGRTLHEHPPTKSGRPPRWSAGHARPDDPFPTQHEVLSCNVAEGNQRRRPEPHTEWW